MDTLITLQPVVDQNFFITLAVVVAVLLVGRFLLNLAMKIVVIVAVIAGVLWLLGSGAVESVLTTGTIVFGAGGI
ncbi:hypothetical protein [Halocatena halophila]|uniref:hypothetical protein n=1 Tax=Halocatena halophila TaxID=2814576 RepID=UPI002ED6A6C8